MKILIGLLGVCLSFHCIVCPPVKPDAKPEEGGTEGENEDQVS